MWSAVDVDSRELLALEASYGRSSLNALSSLKKALRICTNRPLVIVDRGPWYRWAFERLGLEYRYERFGIRNRVERFFGENCSIPLQAKRKKPHIEDNKPIHDILIRPRGQ
jgi:putative transposase